MRAYTDGDRTELTFDSVRELTDATLSCAEAVKATDPNMRKSPEWYGGVSSLKELADIAREGLSAAGIDAMHIAEDKVTVMDREQNLPSFESFYDVTGADVDVARFLSGEPECMINYSMPETPRVGRVITLIISIATPSKVNAQSIRKRGREIVALIFAIEQIGFQVEVWADVLTEERHGAGKSGRIRVKVKEPGGMLDAGEIMFAFTHPGMLRGLALSAMHIFPASFHRELRIGTLYGYPVPAPDLDGYPDGSLLIPPLMKDRDAGNLVTETLRKLEII